MMAIISAIIGNLWKYFNHAMILLIDGLLYIFPSTPNAVKPAVVLASAHDMWPSMPWGTLATSLTAVATVLAAKMIWRIVLSLLP